MEWNAECNNCGLLRKQIQELNGRLAYALKHTLPSKQLEQFLNPDEELLPPLTPQFTRTSERGLKHSIHIIVELTSLQNIRNILQGYQYERNMHLY